MSFSARFPGMCGHTMSLRNTDPGAIQDRTAADTDKARIQNSLATKGTKVAKRNSGKLNLFVSLVPFGASELPFDFSVWSVSSVVLCLSQSSVAADKSWISAHQSWGDANMVREACLFCRPA